MYSKIIIEYQAPYYIIISKRNADVETYYKFINWVSGEFDLYLQEEHNNLEVYFPNASFCIENCQNKYHHFNLIIKIKSKSIITCKKIMNHLERIFDNLFII